MWDYNSVSPIYILQKKKKRHDFCRFNITGEWQIQVAHSESTTT